MAPSLQPSLEASLLVDSAKVTVDRGGVIGGAGYPGARGSWLAAPGTNATVFQWRGTTSSCQTFTPCQ